MEEKGILYKVISVSWPRLKSPFKKLKILPIGNKAELNTYIAQAETINVPRSACVTTGEQIKISNDGDSIFVFCKNGFAQILPIYEAAELFQIGSSSFKVTIKEITELDEKKGYEALTTYHYRDKTLFGRHTPLIAVSQHPFLPKVIGYIDLTSPFFVNTPRRRLFDAPISLNGVAWEKWNTDTTKQYIHLLVRIARCVVHPDLRSSGLGQILVRNAAEFARSHWQMAGWKPYFLEISADMLRYIPFAEKAGMIYIGETEGNLHRVQEDLNYFNTNLQRIRNKEILSGKVSGILDSKLAKFHRSLQNLANDEESQIDEIVAKQLEKPTLDGWAKLKDILSFPKPHFIMGLIPEAQEVIIKRARELDLPTSPAKEGSDFVKEAYNSRLKSPVSIEDLAFEIPIHVNRTHVTHKIERAFEISLDDLTQVVFRNLQFEVLPGEICLITGLSGVGKSILLNLIAGEIRPSRGIIKLPQETNCGVLKQIKSKKPLIEIIGQKDVAKGIYWINRFGLSEPNLYVKPFEALSAGQKYRAMLAYMLVQGFNLWLIDEFCENLDILNTKLISKQVAKLARESGATVILASTSPNRFITELQPDKIVLLKGITNEVDYKIFRKGEFETQMLY